MSNAITIIQPQDNWLKSETLFLEHLYSVANVFRAIEHSSKIGSDRTRQAYTRQVELYLETNRDLFKRDDLLDWALSASTNAKRFLKAALSTWGKFMRRELRARVGELMLHDPDAAASVSKYVEPAFWLIDSITDAIEYKAEKGDSSHLWLTPAEVSHLLSLCDDGAVTGLRNRVVLGLGLSAGLRRSEIVNLTWESLATVDGRVVINVMGKGAKQRQVPIRKEFAETLERWRELTASEPTDRIARGILRGGKITQSMSGVAYFKLVSKFGKLLAKSEPNKVRKAELEKLAPHDLRRTFAQLGWKAGVDITQISKLLGHSNVETTMLYLGVSVDYDDTVSDAVPFF